MHATTSLQPSTGSIPQGTLAVRTREKMQLRIPLLLLRVSLSLEGRCRLVLS
jgi:hypothetical protein